jgi:hypothetical protein
MTCKSDMNVLRVSFQQPCQPQAVDVESPSKPRPATPAQDSASSRSGLYGPWRQTRGSSGQAFSGTALQTSTLSSRTTLLEHIDPAGKGVCYVVTHPRIYSLRAHHNQGHEIRPPLHEWYVMTKPSSPIRRIHYLCKSVKRRLPAMSTRAMRVRPSTAPKCMLLSHN